MSAPWRARASAMPSPMPLVEPVTSAVLPFNMGSPWWRGDSIHYPEPSRLTEIRAMTEPRLNHVQCLDARGLHRMAYWEWGDAANPRVLVCAHGLSRHG